MKRLLTLSLLLPAALCAAPPSPEEFFGHRMGADYKVLDWSKVVTYFQALEKTSERIKIREFGKSTEGRPLIVAYITAPETLKRLVSFQQTQLKLTDPRVTPQAEAAKLIPTHKTIVLITCTVHATEIASTHSAVEYAWRLATATDPKTMAILNNTIVLLAPSINPDGLDIVSQWYRKTLGTPYEGTSPPQLYQKYVGHDNNRDWYIFSQDETRAIVTQLHNTWHPQIVYDVHQMGANAARMFVPPWLDPVEPNVDPLIVQQSNMIGMTMAADLTAAGRKGVAVNAMYDFWTPARHYQAYHGGMRVLSESASVRIASPIKIDRDQLSTNSLGYNAREQSWNHLEPWPGGEWKLRDIVDDQLTAMESLCMTAALRREDLIRNQYNILKRASEHREPYAFIVPAAQTDPGAARKLLETLDFGDVEIEKASAPFNIGEKQYPAGSYVIHMQQPFSAFAKTLLERQRYPDLRMYPGGPPKRPYDVTAHTLPLLMGVDVDVAADQFQAKLTTAKEFAFAVQGLSASDSDSWKKINAAWNSSIPVWRNPKTGDFATGPRKPAGTVELKRPRIGIYKGFVPSMDEGWTRWIVEQFGWQYSSPGNAEIRSGNLRAKYDVIVFPDQGPGVLYQGFRPGSMPEEYTGGLASEGEAALKRFVEEGGRLVFFEESGAFAAGHLGAKVKNTLSGVSNRDFYCPGSLLNVHLEGSSPLTLGLPKEFTIWNEQSPVWESEDPSVKPLVRYAPSSVLASGWLLGEKYLAGKPAMVEVKSGQGSMILFGMRPQYRAQSYLTLKLLFNALVY